MTDFATARRHMVDGQVRTADVTDLRIISAMMDIPREQFVPQASAGLAYLDLDLPVGDGARRLLKPMVLAKLIHAADIACHRPGFGCRLRHRLRRRRACAPRRPGDRARTGRRPRAGRPYGTRRQSNVSVVAGPLTAGWPQGGPYDVIVLEGATEVAPQASPSQLKEGGRLVCVLGRVPAPKPCFIAAAATIWAAGRFSMQRRPLLPGFAKAPVFAF